ncbi:MAG: peroxiredoxin [Cyclobacteriaceae bacterium]
MLNKGEMIPEITLNNQDGNKVSLRDFDGTPLVIYFYPKDNTPGCTAEACSFRDHYEEFKVAGAEVIGVSSDTVASHKSFYDKRKLPFILLSDPYRQAEKAFGVPRNLFGLLPGRVTFIINREGMIVHTFNSSINPIKHVAEALKIISAGII